MGTSIDKLNYMSTTKTKIKDAINLTNVNITTDTFRSYETKFKQGIINTLNNPDAVWNNFTKVTGTGESLALTPTEHAPMVLTLKGQTTQASTPTPSSPQQVHTVSGDNTIEICGKNLANYTKWEQGNFYVSGSSINGNVASANVIRMIDFISVKPSTTYTLSCNTTIGQFGYVYKDTSNNLTGGFWDVSNNFVSFTTPANVNKVRLRIGNSSYQKTYGTDYNIQLEENNEATEYEPYTGNSQLISLGDIELCKIGTYQDKIYKENGIWYLHKEIGKVVLNGSESWQTGSYGTNSYALKVNDLKTSEALGDSNIYILSNLFKGVSYDNRATGGNNIIYSNNDANINLYVRNTSYSTLSAFTTMLGTSNLIVYYVLANSTDTPIEDSELLEQLNSTKSCDGVTNISQSSSYEVFILDAIAIREVE